MPSAQPTRKETKDDPVPLPPARGPDGWRRGGVHRVSGSALVSGHKPFDELRSDIDADPVRVARVALQRAEAERDHWKANHDEVVRKYRHLHALGEAAASIVGDLAVEGASERCPLCQLDGGHMSDCVIGRARAWVRNDIAAANQEGAS